MVRVERDEDFSRNDVPRLNEFWHKHILTEIITREMESARENVSKDEEYHCSCGFPGARPMIGCDKETCPYEWYHWACVGIKKAQRAAKWYCDLCKVSKREKKRLELPEAERLVNELYFFQSGNLSKSQKVREKSGNFISPSQGILFASFSARFKILPSHFH